MNLQELLQPEDILVGFDAADKWDAITRLVHHLAQTGKVPEEAVGRLLDAVMERERSMSTGMENGVAIPHAAVSDLEEVAATLAITAGEGLPFGSIDGSSARFLVLLLIPRPKKLLHIRTLANIARLLSQPEVRDELMACESGAAVWEALGRLAVKAR